MTLNISGLCGEDCRKSFPIKDDPDVPARRCVRYSKKFLRGVAKRTTPQNAKKLSGEFFTVIGVGRSGRVAVVPFGSGWGFNQISFYEKEDLILFFHYDHGFSCPAWWKDGDWKDQKEMR